MQLFKFKKQNKTPENVNAEQIINKKRKTGLPIKLNLGCGGDIKEGWVNIDEFGIQFPGKNETEKGIVIDAISCDLSKGIPVPEGCADVVYSSHFFEHLTPEESLFLFKDSYRVLKEGGLFRIALPDTVTAIRHWFDEESDYLDLLKHDSRNMYKLPDKDNNLDFLNYIIFQSYEHKLLYNEQKVIDILDFIGFKKAYTSSFNAEYDIDLDIRRKYSFYVEAIK